MSTSDLRGRLQWREGAVLDGDVRYLLLRGDSLMGMFRRLPPAARRDALEAFADSVREAGGRSLDRYLATRPAESVDLPALLERNAATLGWGRWRLRRGPETLLLTVVNGPFAAAYGASDEPVCAPLRGMLAAIAERVLGGGIVVEELACAACAAPACELRAGRAGRPAR